jgi:3-oxoacyl-(acyl-carrier-protein) synthase
MRLALEGAPFTPKELDLILASANGSGDLDGKEAGAIEALLAGSSGVAVAGIKALLGETLGASAALQTMAALGAVAGVQREVKNVLLNAIDPGGSVVSLAVQRTVA